MHFRDLLNLLRLPPLDINLMLEKTADNDPFYAFAVQHFYDDAVSRHPKYFLTRKYQYGFAVCRLTRAFDDYFKALDSSARRNYQKAQRAGFEFRRFDYNTQLEGIRDIWLSTPIRQGLMPEQMREGRVMPILDPPSRTLYHDYPYYGVFKGDRLVAYAGCLIAGEIGHLNDLYGHADFLKDCVVPMVVINIARELQTTYPLVKYYAYGTFYGSGEGLRRFKQKFNFVPYNVSWQLRSPLASSEAKLKPLAENRLKVVSQ